MTDDYFGRELQRVAPNSMVAAEFLGVPLVQIGKWSSGRDPEPAMAKHLLLNYLPSGQVKKI
ncbi:hypothetical protein [Bosea sp. BIWAKO-01]|uniref:hypothetical protein n=1 Tax=Bosea sp. BIWAKO-01 TaxID=506668 RepID=UPI00114D2144|nr:hypothetical protein [Bosea sp. BIWAKO-01]